MRITDKALDEFIEIYNEDFGRELNREKAREAIFRITKLYELLANKARNASPQAAN